MISVQIQIEIVKNMVFDNCFTDELDESNKQWFPCCFIQVFSDEVTDVMRQGLTSPKQIMIDTRGSEAARTIKENETQAFFNELDSSV